MTEHRATPARPARPTRRRSTAPASRGLASARHGTTSSAARRSSRVADLAVVLQRQGRASRTSTLDVYENTVTAFIGPSGCGKCTFIRCFNRMNDLIPGAESTARSSTTARISTAATSTRSRCAAASGWSSRSRTRSRSRSTTTSPSGPRVLGMKGDLDERVESALRQRGALGRGEGPAQGRRPRPLGRSAAAPLHRSRARGRARRHPDGRARLGTRPDLDGADRGPHARAEARVHDRDRHAQHAAGGARGRHDGVLQRRRARRRERTARHPRRVRRDRRRSSRTPSDKRTEDYVTGRFG